VGVAIEVLAEVGGDAGEEGFGVECCATVIKVYLT
jgi:hypothetical protein